MTAGGGRRDRPRSAAPYICGALSAYYLVKIRCGTARSHEPRRRIEFSQDTVLLDCAEGTSPGAASIRRARLSRLPGRDQRPAVEVGVVERVRRRHYICEQPA